MYIHGHCDLSCFHDSSGTSPHTHAFPALPFVDRRALDKYSQTFKGIEQGQDVAAARVKAQEEAVRALAAWDKKREQYEALGTVLKRHNYKYSSELEQDLQREVDDDEMR
jgi:hypothetical protein